MQKTVFTKKVATTQNIHHPNHLTIFSF